MYSLLALKPPPPPLPPEARARSCHSDRTELPKVGLGIESVVGPQLRTISRPSTATFFPSKSSRNQKFLRPLAWEEAPMSLAVRVGAGPLVLVVLVVPVVVLVDPVLGGLVVLGSCPTRCSWLVLQGLPAPACGGTATKAVPHEANSKCRQHCSSSLCASCFPCAPR
eukprot:Skav233091  [mRNA]  locus=scaffold3868:26746:30516:+ [translate_table: standard]